MAKPGQKQVIFQKTSFWPGFANLDHIFLYNIYCISQKAWTLFWKMIFTQAFTSHSYGVLGNLVD
jgi:hypothetical protein